MKLPVAFNKEQSSLINIQGSDMNCKEYVQYLIEQELNPNVMRTGFASARHNNPMFFINLKRMLEKEIKSFNKKHQSWNSFDQIYYSNICTIYKYCEMVQ